MATTQLVLVALALSPVRGDMGRAEDFKAPLVDLRGPIIVLTPSDAVLEEATRVAASAWNEWKRVPAFTVGPGGIPVGWDDSLSVAAGWYPDRRRIEISTAYRPGVDCLRCAIAHELGHVIGVGHGEGGPFGLDEGPPEEAVR